MQSHPGAELFIELLPSNSGGRQSAIELVDGKYRPHLRVRGSDELLGVVFVEAKIPSLAPGMSTYARAGFLYAPSVDYSSLSNEVPFDLLEGEKIVGHGHVICTIKNVL